MAAPRTPPAVARRYPTLRFLVKLSKASGGLALAIGGIIGLLQVASLIRFGSVAGLIAMLSTILPSVMAGGALWMVAEGIEVFIDIEENTRQIAAQPTPAAPQAGITPISIGQLLDQMAAGQVQTNQRLDALIAALAEVRGGVGAGVQGVEAIAESSRAIAETSKATATILYRQGVKQP